MIKIMKDELLKLISSIAPADEKAMADAEKRQAMLAKPPKSLGRLEDLSVQLAGITGKVNNRIDTRCLFVFAADNGVVCEGVSSAPQSVTLMQAVNLTKAKTGASVLCKYFDCNLLVYDVGINAEVTEKAIINRKLAYGAANIAQGPAMSRDDAGRMILIGAEAVKSNPADVVGVGEMGIGNTTTAAAVLAVLMNKPVELVTGKGGGITQEAFIKKKDVIRRAITLNNPDATDVIDVISKVGGFDIAAMCGAFLGAAAMRRPVVIDGFISAVAALCAYRLCPNVIHYLIPSHASYEIGYRLAMEKMGLKPFFALDMRLGEGSGCPLTFQLLEASCAIINDMATFAQAGINDDYLTEIRKGDCFDTESKSE